MTHSISGRNLRGAFVAVTSLFFMWGFITVLVDSFVPRLRAVFELASFEAAFVQSAWFLAYGLLSIPGSYLISKIGYQRGILVGLATAGLGCLLFYPAAATRLYPLFLLALFVTGGGLTVLQVAANPYISVLGPEESASARLNLSQAFNSLGTTIAPLVAASFLLGNEIKSREEIDKLTEIQRQVYFASEASDVQVPFVLVALALFLLALVVGVIKLPKILGNQDEDSKTIAQVLQGYAEVFRNRKLRFGALAIFVYVGAEVALGSFMVDFGLSLDIASDIRSNGVLNSMAEAAEAISGKKTLEDKGLFGALLTFYWGGAMLGRFAGSGLMRWFSPSRLLTLNGLCAVFLICMSILSSGVPALLFLLGVGFFNSIMFPTIFTSAIEDLGESKPQGSGLLCTAIVGGAFIPPAVGALVDGASFEVAFLLPVVCYAYIAWYAGRLVPHSA